MKEVVVLRKAIYRIFTKYLGESKIEKGWFMDLYNDVVAYVEEYLISKGVKNDGIK